MISGRKQHVICSNITEPIEIKFEILNNNLKKMEEDNDQSIIE